jgi:hypothetical protein
MRYLNFFIYITVFFAAALFLFSEFAGREDFTGKNMLLKAGDMRRCVTNPFLSSSESGPGKSMVDDVVKTLVGQRFYPDSGHSSDLVSQVLPIYFSNPKDQPELLEPRCVTLAIGMAGSASQQSVEGQVQAHAARNRINLESALKELDPNGMFRDDLSQSTSRKILTEIGVSQIPEFYLELMFLYDLKNSAFRPTLRNLFFLHNGWIDQRAQLLILDVRVLPVGKLDTEGHWLFDLEQLREQSISNSVITSFGYPWQAIPVAADALGQSRKTPINLVISLKQKSCVLLWSRRICHRWLGS